jgi:hypothetical protein
MANFKNKILIGWTSILKLKAHIESLIERMSYNIFNRHNIKGLVNSEGISKKIIRNKKNPLEEDKMIIFKILSFVGKEDSKQMNLITKEWHNQHVLLFNIRKFITGRKESDNHYAVSMYHIPNEILALTLTSNDYVNKNLSVTYEFDRLRLKFWRVLFTGPKITLKTEFQKINSMTIIFLCHGGDFAASIFENGQPTLHKTFSKYIVRKKQGKRQGGQDKSSRPQSMGAFIRRRNEDAFNEKVEEFCESWKDFYEKAHLIILHAPGHNRDLFKALMGFESKIRSVPFSTGTPTFTQVEEVYKKLLTVEVEGTL